MRKPVLILLRLLSGRVVPLLLLLLEPLLRRPLVALSFLLLFLLFLQLGLLLLGRDFLPLRRLIGGSLLFRLFNRRRRVHHRMPRSRQSPRFLRSAGPGHRDALHRPARRTLDIFHFHPAIRACPFTMVMLVMFVVRFTIVTLLRTM